MSSESAGRVMTVMAHPDDAEILTGGTLLQLHDKDWEVGIATMTAGDCGSVQHTKEEIVRKRYQELQDAAEYVDAQTFCAGFQDLEVFLNSENLRKVVELVRSFDPDVILTHSPVDYLLDHEQTAQLARSAAFSATAPLYKTKAVPPAEPMQDIPALYYADPVEGVDAMGDRIPPHFYVEIDGWMETKADMLACHESQREWLREQHGMDQYIEEMKSFAASYGDECNAEYAEGFRQHLGHGYPDDDRLQSALDEQVHVRTE